MDEFEEWTLLTEDEKYTEWSTYVSVMNGHLTYSEYSDYFDSIAVMMGYLNVV